jgi:hypothetical protein
VRAAISPFLSFSASSTTGDPCRHSGLSAGALKKTSLGVREHKRIVDPAPGILTQNKPGMLKLMDWREGQDGRKPAARNVTMLRQL